jgi:hypothetical protein
VARPPAHATPVTPTRIFMAGIVAVVGLIWLLQGLGVPIGKSFMIGDPFWAIAGVAMIVGAPIYAAWPRLRRR